MTETPERIVTVEEFTHAVISIVRTVTIRNGEEWTPFDQIKQMLTSRDAAIRQEPKWISVKERLPEIGQLVAYSRDVGDRRIVDAVHWSDEEEKYMGPQWNNITNWMPLPEPPVGKEGEE